MLARCRQNTSKVNIRPSTSADPAPRNTIQMVELAAAINAARDDVRLSNAVKAQVAQQATPTGQASASHSPRNVATPLPPRKPSQIG